MAAEPVFAVGLRCTNCGKEWDESFLPLVRVKWSEKVGAVIASDTTCSEFGMFDCECCRAFSCPTCELTRQVEIVDRVPVERQDELFADEDGDGDGEDNTVVEDAEGEGGEASA